MNNDRNLRVIKTARNEKDINAAVAKGFRPIIKLVIPSREIKSKFAILQDKRTGEIEVVNDYRAPKYNRPNASDVVIDFTYYYPYRFENPYAAYLIPPGIHVGETVFLEDLIEDVLGSTWNQGDAFRLKACKAVWDGKEFILQYEPSKVADIVG